MTKAVKTVPFTVSAQDALEAMRANRIRHLVVTDGGRVVGILSDRDLGGRRGAAARQSQTVAELMTAPVVTTEPTTTIRAAANLMRGRSIGSLVVVESGRTKGIVTVADLLTLVGRGLNRGVTTTKRWTLTHRTPHRKVRRPTGTW
jgi:acetoin utilization protein AcuB